MPHGDVFERDAVIGLVRADQAGQTTSPEFLAAISTAGVTVTLSTSTPHRPYSGHDDICTESYASVQM